MQSLALPEPSKKAESKLPVELMTCFRSALNNNNGIVNGSRNSKTVEYAGASQGIMPKLLAASPTKVLTRAALTMLPIFVFSDLEIHHQVIVLPFTGKFLLLP